MPSPLNLTQIPSSRVPFIDERTGLMSREWYRFFINLFTLTGDGSNTTSITDLQLGPESRDITGSISDAIARAQLASDTPLSLDYISEMMKRVEALEAAPQPQPYHKRPAYGSFYDTTTQTAAVINTAYGITFDTTDLTFGVYRGSPTSRIYVDTQGVYNIQFSAQLDNTSGGNHLIYIWLRVNGVDVTYSASQVRLKGTDGELVAAWNFVQNLKANDYFELMWSVSDTSVQILSSAAVAPVPAIPSVILTVTDNISA